MPTFFRYLSIYDEERIEALGGDTSELDYLDGTV